MTVNVPREMRTLSVSRDFYNENNGAGDDIDSAVLKHTIGDPKRAPMTFLNAAEAQESSVVACSGA